MHLLRSANCLPSAEIFLFQSEISAIFSLSLGEILKVLGMLASMPNAILLQCHYKRKDIHWTIAKSL